MLVCYVIPRRLRGRPNGGPPHSIGRGSHRTQPHCTALNRTRLGASPSIFLELFSIKPELFNLKSVFRTAPKWDSVPNLSQYLYDKKSTFVPFLIRHALCCTLGHER